MTARTSTPDPVAAPEHTTGSTTLGVADRHADTLRVLGAKAAALNTALVDAQLATDTHALTETLTDLHQQLRAMAGLVNDALGGWPDPPVEPQ